MLPRIHFLCYRLSYGSEAFKAPSMMPGRVTTTYYQKYGHQTRKKIRNQFIYLAGLLLGLLGGLPSNY